MMRFRERKTWIVFIAVLMLFAACKGESPTAPPPGGGIPPGGTAPPSGVTVTLGVSNANPVVDSTVTVTATVTQNGSPVPNGTAVEFQTTEGSLDNGGQQIIKTTTNGVATVTLTRGTVGNVTVTAVVNNVSRTIGVNFVARPITPTPPNTSPTITGVTPNVGRPTGGETIRITGTNFTAPVRVLFRYAGLINPVEAFVVSVTPTQIEVVTPSVNLGAGQQLPADIIVLTQAGTVNENRAELAGAFTFRNEQLTPVISTVTPNSGPVLGGTRVTVFGEGFQEPLQVLFDTAEARVLNVKYNEILVETPAGRDTSPTGEGPVLGPVTVTVRNINSNRSGTLAAAFHYKNAVQITAAGPTEGPFTGGTRVTIEGSGFVAPVAVTIGGVAAQPISVSGTRIVAITSGVALDSCDDVEGPIEVVNIVNGDGATGPSFTFRVLDPAIISVSQNATPGGTVSIVVANAIGIPRLSIGTFSLAITGATDNGNGTTTFTATIPNTVILNTQACPAVPGATRDVPTSFGVTYESVTTGCTDTIDNGITLVPLANTPELTLSPAAYAPFNATITPATPDPDGAGPLTGTPASVAPSAPQTVTLTNTGTGTLTVQSVTPGAGCGNFVFSNPTPPTPVGPCDPFPITAVYQGQTTTVTNTCTVTVQTDAGTRTLTLTGTSR